MSVVYRVDGGREVHKLMNSLSGRELNNRVRRATRRGAAIARTEVRSEAKRRSDLPDSFARTATRYHRNPIGTSTGPTSPLLNIFEVGAGVHGVGMGAPNSRGTKAILFNSETGFMARAPVTHPGMDARPLIAPVFEREQDDMSEAAMTELMAGLR